MNARRKLSSLLLFAAFVAISTLNADDASISPTMTALADFDLKSDGKDVRMILKITKTQLIGGTHEGEFPHVILHPAEMKEAPHLVVYANGDLADALHRFACIGTKGGLIGRSIEVSGKVKIHTDFAVGEDQTPI